MEESEVENDQVVSISEFIKGLEEKELEADLVLGVNEDQECTYEKGYMPRQAVFSCLFCTPAGNAGFCTACSLVCHDGHQVVELWTRRGFRCDCGNEKFGDIECKLFKDKDPLNKANVYNQNYSGLYCTCRRPYPDPEGTDQGEMLQCCICEDWFHETHLGLSSSQQVPRDDDGEASFDELICQSCVGRCSFLSYYPDLLVPPTDSQDSDEDLVTSVNEVVELPSSSLVLKKDNKAIDLQSSQQLTNGTSSDLSGSNGKLSDSTTVERQMEQKPENSKVGNSDRLVGESSRGGVILCKLKRTTEAGPSDQLESHEAGDGKEKIVKTNALELGSAIFLARTCEDLTWREELCQCEACMATYALKGVLFLVNKGDTIQEYEATAKRKREENQKKEEGTAQDFMKKLGHVQKMELMHGLNDMATELESFLTPFGQNGKTVTSADIYDFFENLQQKRRRKN